MGIWALAALCACGGGDGGAGGKEAPTDGAGVAQPSAAKPVALLSFQPLQIAANVAYNASATVVLRAKAQNASLFGNAVYALVADEANVLMPNVELVPVDQSTVSVTFHTRPSLEAGRRQGTVKVQLCHDADCALLISGTTVQVPYDITVSDSPLSADAAKGTAATVHRGGVVPKAVEVSVYGAMQGWSATASASWLKIVKGSGRGPGSFAVIYDSQSLAEGVHEATVTVQSTDGQTVALPFTLEVMPTEFTINAGVPTFSAVNGAPIAPQTLRFDLDNGFTSKWSATSSASWLKLSPGQGSTPALIGLQPDPTQGALASGTYRADIVLSSGTAASKTVATQLILTKPVLSASAWALTFGGAKGRNWKDPASLSVSLNTGSNAWPYTLSALPAWLSASAMSGSVGQEPATLAFSLVERELTPGSSSATATLTAKVNGDVVTLPMTMNVNVDQRRLLASEWGVAMSNSPAGTSVKRAINIRDNFGLGLKWTASSDAPWLTVTSAGNTADASAVLNIEADPASLPLEAVSHANVTIRTATAGVEPAVVRVALWRSASGAVKSANVAEGYTRLLADKIRPYVYASNSDTSVAVFNAYTAQKVATLKVDGAFLSAMSVSLDGSKLYAVDTVWRKIHVFDLKTMSKVDTWVLDQSVQPPNGILSIRTNGVDILLFGDGRAYVDGRLLSGSHFSNGYLMLASPDGQSVYSAGVVYEVDYSAISGGTFFKTLKTFVNSGASSSNDWAVNTELDRYYGAGNLTNSGGGYGCGYGTVSTGQFVMSLRAAAYPNNVEVTREGRMVCGSNNPGSQWDWDLLVAEPEGKQWQFFRMAGPNKSLLDGQLVVTPDGKVAVGLTSDPRVSFIALP